VASAASMFNRAVQLHREAAAHTEAARVELATTGSEKRILPGSAQSQRELATRLALVAPTLAPGWLGADLDNAVANRPLGADAMMGRPALMRVGTARPVPDAEFPALVPFLGGGHIAIDADARDPRVTAWLRAMLLRTMASLPGGAVRVIPVDGGTLGAVFGPFRTLVDVEAWRKPITNVDGFRHAFDEAEGQIVAAQGGAVDLPYLVLAVGALPVGAGSGDWARLAALAHAGPAARVHLLIAGYPPAAPAGYDRPPRLDHTTFLTADGDTFRISDPAGPEAFSRDGKGLGAPVTLDPAPVDGLIENVCRRIAGEARSQSAVDFSGLMPEQLWEESSATGLRTVVGREQRQYYTLALDDATPHWLIGGRTGSGKTVFLLDVLYGLASRYSPDELGLYLLDFKEGVSFAEFTPTAVDRSWVPHARTVGIESDREYGLAVLKALAREMSRRAVELKQAGVTRIADLRAGRPDIAMPRLVAVIDEFHVLFTGNDRLAGQAAAALEEIARKGRSYGIHLILASQTISGVEALFTKGESIFGQFPVRVALAGGGGVLDSLNSAADNLPVGTAVINHGAGVPAANAVVRFPDAVASAVAAQRHRLWEARLPGGAPPAVFAGYAAQHLDDDPLYRRVTSKVRRRQVMVGRTVDVGLPTATFTFDPSPGRHLAVLGTSPVAADLLHAAALSLAKQHDPGTANFLLAPLVAAADEAADATADALHQAGHQVDVVDTHGLRGHLGMLAAAVGKADPHDAPSPTYVVIFGTDAAGTVLAQTHPTTYRTGHDDLRTLLRGGAAAGVHVIGWWRGVRRYTEDITGPAGVEDVACLVALNIPSNDLAAALGDYTIEWTARPNRALLVDRHDNRMSLIVPFVRPGTATSE
jgi:S-DNA-T family DNA segregation ATPase FtsK/SpoIIIE